MSSAGDQGRREQAQPTRGVAADAGAATVQAVRWASRRVRGHMVDAVGGPARARVITLLACVLALNSADTSTIGAVAPQLKVALGINNAQIGLLSSVTLLVGAVFVIPFGLFVDRAKRVPMLSLSIVLWSVASLASAFAGSYSTLLLTRLLMGAVTATAGPAIASLTGDYFPSRERGRIYAYILGGEIAGTAVGFTISGSVASAISWRVAFVLLAIPGFFLARELWRTVPEPRRGGQSRLEPGVVDLHAAVHGDGDEWSWRDRRGAAQDRGSRARGGAQARRQTRPASGPATRPGGDAHRRGGALHPHDPDERAADRQLCARLLLLRRARDLPRPVRRGATTTSARPTTMLALLLLVIASVIGTLVSGRITDAMVRRGAVEARMWVPAVCYMAATVVFIPGVLGHSVTPALWFDIAGAALLSAANPPLDAARLDIVPAALWGRAESTRTVARSLAQALAPIVFGLMADLINGARLEEAPIGTHAHRVTSPRAPTDSSTPS